jgi:hypothetical protein
MQNNQPDFKLSSDTIAIARALETLAIGESISYNQLTGIIGRDITQFRNALESARHTVLRDKQMVFDTLRGVGLIRLNDSEIVDLSDKAREQSRKLAKRIAKKLVCVNYNSLSKEKQVKHNTALSMFGVIAELSSSSSVKRLEQKIEEHGGSLPLAKAALAALAAKDTI